MEISFSNFFHGNLKNRTQNMFKKIAFFVKELPAKNWKGRAFLYKIRDIDEKYVVVSTIFNFFSGPEVMVFPSIRFGVVEKYTDLYNSNLLNPDKAIVDMGYELQNPTIGNIIISNYKNVFTKKCRQGNLVKIISPTFTSLVIEGKIDINDITTEILNANGIFSVSKNALNRNCCMLLSQPKQEKNYNIFVLEVLSGNKVFTIFSDFGKNPNFDYILRKL